MLPEYFGTGLLFLENALCGLWDGCERKYKLNGSLAQELRKVFAG